LPWAEVNRENFGGNQLVRGFKLEIAILDRFLHHAITIAITGRSYRVKDSLPAPPEPKKGRKTNEPSTAGAAS